MDSLIQLQENEEEDVVEGVPVCAANLVSQRISLDKFTTKLDIPCRFDKLPTLPIQK